MKLSRKSFLLGAGALVGSLSAPQPDDPWRRVPRILKRVRPPRFPRRDFVVTDYGAVGDGATSCTAAFRAAVRACCHAGGGRVVVPAGVFVTGPIHLRDNVNLHVSEGAVVAFSQRPEDYLPVVFTRYEGVELLNYSPFVYAHGRTNVAVTGSGVLDGRADNDHWWPWKGSGDHGWEPGEPHERDDRSRLFALAEAGVPVSERVFGAGHYIRPNFVQLYRCRNVLVEGVRIVNSPMWEIHPVLCRNVTIRGVRVESHGPNNDGCNPESCVDVHVVGSSFDTGDDCIAIKAGRNADGRRLAAPSENIVVERCVMRDGHGGVVIGSEMTGGVRNIFVRDCTMSSPNLDRVLRMKTNSLRGGFVHDMHVRDIDAPQVAWAVIEVNFFYEEGPGWGFDPDVRGISVANLQAGGPCTYALYLRGYPTAPVRDVAIRDSTFDNVVPEPGRTEIRLENTSRVRMDNVHINGVRYDGPLS